ncbi:MAG: zinc ribbon domain-containing protein [Candidatus Heimdallarchaeota archaeon]|nr:zinc ribbon domain-containing protein [Candidatus Heimdallarchaeota archaeon]
MIFISEKSCPICKSILSSKVAFCPYCGSGVQELSGKSIDSRSSSNKPILNQLGTYTDDLPEGMQNNQSRMIKLTENNEPLAWTTNGNNAILKLKGRIKYLEGNFPFKINLPIFKSFSLFENLIILFFSLITGLTFLFLIGIGCLLYLSTSHTSSTPYIVFAVSFLIFTIFNYYKSQYLFSVLISKKNVSFGKQRRSFIEYSVIQLLHLGIVLALIQLLFSISTSFLLQLEINVQFYILIAYTITIIAITSPPFRIAKKLALLRKSGIFQTFFNSFQFQKISFKRIFGITVFSCIIPVTISLLCLEPLISFMNNLFLQNTSSISGWGIVAICVSWLSLSTAFMFNAIEDSNTTMEYELLLREYSLSPSLDWISSQNDINENNNKVFSETLESKVNISEVHQITNFTDSMCPHCSAKLVVGVVFCTDCGRKVKY